MTTLFIDHAGNELQRDDSTYVGFKSRSEMLNWVSGDLDCPGLVSDRTRKNYFDVIVFWGSAEKPMCRYGFDRKELEDFNSARAERIQIQNGNIAPVPLTTIALRGPQL